jgi:hypothetical protein
MSSGLLLIGAGLWVLVQLFQGQALARLGILGQPTKPGATAGT